MSVFLAILKALPSLLSFIKEVRDDTGSASKFRFTTLSLGLLVIFIVYLSTNKGIDFYSQFKNLTSSIPKIETQYEKLISEYSSLKAWQITAKGKLDSLTKYIKELESENARLKLKNTETLSTLTEANERIQELNKIIRAQEEANKRMRQSFLKDYEKFKTTL